MMKGCSMFFCENHSLADFINSLRTPTVCHSVKLQLLQSLGILVQNARRVTSTFYLLSGGFLNSLFDEPPDLEDEEILAYYVTLLKGVALQVDGDSCQLCLNNQSANSPTHRLPLFERAVHLADHKDSMVRTACRTALLSLLRIQDSRVRCATRAACQQLLVPKLVVAWCSVDKDRLTLGALREGEEDLLGFLSDLFFLDIPEVNGHLAQQLGGQEMTELLTVIHAETKQTTHIQELTVADQWVEIGSEAVVDAARRPRNVRSDHHTAAEDRPGSYVLVQDIVVLRTAELPRADQPPESVVALLAAGAVVDIVEVSCRSEDNKVRGRLRLPSGWISLVNIETGYRWAVRQYPAYTASALHCSEPWPGQRVEYDSISAGGWISSSVAAVGVHGAVQLHCKLGYWMSPEEQAQKLRWPVTTPSLAAADGLL